MAGPLGIVAGGGALPRRLVEACRDSGRGAFVIAIEGQTDPATVTGSEHPWVRMGQSERAIRALREAGARELGLAGPVKRSEEPRAGKACVSPGTSRWWPCH